MAAIAERPPFDPAQAGRDRPLPVSSGVLLGRVSGISMWPALHTSDLVFGHPFRAGEIVRPGTVLVVEGPDGLIAHRLEGCRGRPGKRRFLMAGDLSGPDFPFREAEVRGVAETIYRKGVGFLDIPPALDLGPIGRRLLARCAQLWEWLEARRPVDAPRPLPPLPLPPRWGGGTAPSDSSTPLLQ